MSAGTEYVDAAAVVMHVTRGNVAVDVPVTLGVAIGRPVADLATTIAIAIIELERASPGRATAPIDGKDVPLALRPRGADEPLDPERPLLAQTEGHWRAEDLPVAGRREGTARLPVGAFELIDAKRPSILIRGARRLVGRG